MLEVGYVGVRGVKFPMHRRFNQPDRVTEARPNPLLIPGGYYVDNSESTVYHSLQTSLRKRFSRNLSFDMHYTYGKGLAFVGGDVGVYYGTDANDQIQDFFNTRLDRGPATGDVRHRFIGDGVYQLPYLTNWGVAPLRHILGGWQISGIFSARTGTPALITQSCAGSYHCRVDYVGGDPIFKDYRRREISAGCPPGGRCAIQYLNPAAFARIGEAPIAIRPGTASKSLIRNLGSWGVDLSLAKNFRIREEMKLQFRADMFNALNHVNLGAPSTGIDSSTFGRITGAGGMRSMQVGLRFQF
jgi:hypothetical protein